MSYRRRSQREEKQEARRGYRMREVSPMRREPVVSTSGLDGSKIVLVVLLLDRTIQDLQKFLKSKNFNRLWHTSDNEQALSKIYVDFYVRACRYAEHTPGLLAKLPLFEDLLFDAFPEKVNAVIESGFNLDVFMNLMVKNAATNQWQDSRFKGRKRYGYMVRM